MNDEFLFASSLDAQPIAYKGATASEILMMLKVIPLLSGIFGFFVGLMIGGFSAAILAMLIGAIILSMLGIYIFASLMTTIKLGKPEGYVLQWLAIKLNQYLGFKVGFIRKAGYWSDSRL